MAAMKNADVARVDGADVASKLLMWHSVVGVLVVLFVVILLVSVRSMLLKSRAVLGRVVVVLVVCMEIRFVVCRLKKHCVTRYLWQNIAHVLSVCVVLVV